MIATEWDSQHGGLSTFNRELCVAISSLGHAVYCLVPSASASEVAAAAAEGVTVLVADDAPGVSDETRLGTFAGLPDGRPLDVIVGHDRVTGAIAQIVGGRLQPSKRVHFVHVPSGTIEWFKDRPVPATVRATERESLEIALARSASLVAAVGPLIRREVSVLLSGIRNDVHEFRPGLGKIRTRGTDPHGAQCLVLGRAEDEELKGLDIAARAFGLLDEDMQPRPVLVIRGAPPATGDGLRVRMLSIAARPGVDIRVRPYDPKTDQIVHDLLQSSVVLMPSRTEGFGLVGLEGIACGIPVLLSDRSGLAELLRSLVPDIMELHVVPVTGDLSHDGPVWARKIRWILQNPQAAHERALGLRDRLEKLLSWKDSAANLLSAIHAAPLTAGVPDRRKSSDNVVGLTNASRLRNAIADTCVADLADIRSWGWTDRKLHTELYQLDYETIEGITDGHSGLIEQWGPVFAEHPETWRILHDGLGNVVGYWHFVPLFDDKYEEAREGRLLDITITADQVRSFEIPGTYDVYFAGICVRAQFRRPQVMKLLFRSILEVLQNLAREGIFIGEICANGFTSGGAGLCKTLGMRRHVRHADHGEIYVARMIDLLSAIIANEFVELRRLYGLNERRPVPA